jgi:hypothetical protein
MGTNTLTVTHQYSWVERFSRTWRPVLFTAYFHGDIGAGLGASHQTGWAGWVAKLIQLFGLLDAKKLLEAGKAAAFIRSKQRGEVQK